MTDTSCDINRFRGGIVGIDIAWAMANGHTDAAHALACQEAQRGAVNELIAGLASSVVSLGLTLVAESDGKYILEAVMASLRDRYQTGLEASIEIAAITNHQGGHHD